LAGQDIKADGGIAGELIVSRGDSI